MSMRRIALVGGYTAGHVLPMITVAEAYRRRHPRAEILFLGSRDGPEAGILSQHGCTLLAIDGAPLYGATCLHGRLRAYGLVCRSFWRARQILAEAEVELVMGFGGYITAAPLLAARSLKLATAVFEANGIPGLANRWLSRWADLLLAASPAVTSHPRWRDAIVVDYPVRRDVLALAAERRGAIAESNGPLRILVTAGSRGSAFLNDACPALMATLARGGVAVSVHHQSGLDGAASVEADYCDRGLSARVEPFITDMAAAYRRADLVICGAGAGTLAEIAALSLPALVVPIASVADDHQSANAAAFARVRLNVAVLAEKAWDVDLAAARVREIVAAEASAPYAIGAGGAEAIVEECERLVARNAPRRSVFRLMGGPRESASS